MSIEDFSGGNSSGGFDKWNDSEGLSRAGLESWPEVHSHIFFTEAEEVAVNHAFARGGLGNIHDVRNNGLLPGEIVAKIPRSSTEGFLKGHLDHMSELLMFEFGIAVDYPTQQKVQDLADEEQESPSGIWFLNSKSVLDCCRQRLASVKEGVKSEELSPLGIYKFIKKELHNLWGDNSGEYQLAYFTLDEHLQEYFMNLECLWRYQNIYGTERKFSDSIPTYPLPIVHGLGFQIAGFNYGEALFTTAIVMDKLSGTSYSSPVLGSSIKDGDFVRIKEHCQEFFRTLGMEHGDLSRANVWQKIGSTGEVQLEIIDLGKVGEPTNIKFASPSDYGGNGS